MHILPEITENTPIQMDLASLMVSGAATSYHPSYPPSNVLDQSLKKFWVSTGLFKHELLFTFKESSSFGKISLVLSRVAQLEIWIGRQDIPLDFELLKSFGKSLIFIIDSIEDSENLQSISVSEPLDQIKHVKIKIIKGYSNFVAIYRLSIS